MNRRVEPVLRLPAVCIVTRGRGTASSPERSSLLERLAAAARAGAAIVQVRERQLDDRQLLEFVTQVIGMVRPAGTLVLVNDRVDVALAAGADGVHLKSDAPPAGDVRQIASPELVIGRSVHSAEEAAAAGACDYLVFGTVFPSGSKPAGHPVAGIEALKRVCESTTLPVFAIGGISVNRATAVAAAGAAGVAAIGLFSDANDISATVTALRSALTRHAGDVRLGET